MSFLQAFSESRCELPHGSCANISNQDRAGQGGSRQDQPRRSRTGSVLLAGRSRRLNVTTAAAHDRNAAASTWRSFSWQGDRRNQVLVSDHRRIGECVAHQRGQPCDRGRSDQILDEVPFEFADDGSRPDGTENSILARRTKCWRLDCAWGCERERRIAARRYWLRTCLVGHVQGRRLLSLVVGRG